MDSFQAIDHSDSRYAMKQRDIAATVTRMGEQTAAARKAWEDNLGDMLDEVTAESVLRGGGDRSILHGSERFRTNYQNWLDSLRS